MTTCEKFLRGLAFLGLGAALFVVSSCSLPRFADRPGFVSPERAVEEVVAALRVDDLDQLALILGPESKDLLDSGDAVDDTAARRGFVEHYDEAHSIEWEDDSTAILHIGKEIWPFPIPIVRMGDSWYLDTEEGAEELLDRRIGGNELAVIQVLLALVDAQEDYAAEDWDGDGVFEYAGNIRSTPGKKDGLYWTTGEGEEPSPIGELMARAESEGYGRHRAAEEDLDDQPYHGYLFRLMSAQGEHANGGAYEYMAGNQMIGGFAVVAYPASYGDSGIMSFLVNHDGVVYEKDLGAGSETAESMTAFNPDDSWKVVKED